LVQERDTISAVPTVAWLPEPKRQAIIMTTSAQDKKHLRRIGHGLNPLVTVAGKGLTDNVVAELGRALDDHELIKVKIAVGDRDAKQAVIAEIVAQTNAEVVQSIGHVILLYRAARQPNPKLSNLLRPQ